LNLKTAISSVFKVLAIVLVIAVLLPSAVKLNHIFTHHEHEVCDEKDALQTHFHELDVECDFYKFKLTTQYYFQNELTTTIDAIDNFKISVSQYEFVSNYQKRHTALRGPPQMI